MRGSPSRAINRGLLTFTRPVFPSPTQPGWNQRRFGFPPSSAPRRHRQRTSGAGTGHRARTWNYRSTHMRRSPIRQFTQYVRPRVARREPGARPGPGRRPALAVAHVSATTRERYVVDTRVPGEFIRAGLRDPLPAKVVVWGGDVKAIAWHRMPLWVRLSGPRALRPAPRGRSKETRSSRSER